MINVVYSLLHPILSPMGVSDADLMSYLTSCAGYIYAIVITLIIAIAVIVYAAVRVKKGTKHVVVWSSCAAWLAVVCIIANAVCFGPLHSNVAMFLNNGQQVSDQTKSASKEVVKEIGEEGMVLLKNENLLPLTDGGNLNVFGWDSVSPIFGGSGSGSADTSAATGVLQALSDAGFTTNQELSDFYTAYNEGRGAAGINISSTDWTLPEPPVDTYTDELINNAKDFSDTALIVLGRSGGEGQDLPTDMKAVIDGSIQSIRDTAANGNESYNYFNMAYTNNGSYDDFESGESYLELSKTEEDLVDLVCGNFSNVIVIVNANNTMELGWVNDYDQIKSVILAPGPGEAGFSALGEIIKGDVNPSGHTVDTYLYDLTTAPSYNNRGAFGFTNVSDIQQAVTAADGAYEGAVSFVRYTEGIYNGYKFFETAAEEGFLDYDKYVQYPFGYGLSYTTFEQTIQNFSADGDNITFDVEVKNTGDVAGKDAVEIYFTPPYENGGIEKASVNLVNFEKTELIEPGQSQTVSFTISKEDLASYDSEEIKVKGGGYILEAGEYTISARADSHTVFDQESFTVDADVDYSKDGRSSDGIPAVNQFAYAKGNVTYLSRADGFANYEEATAAPKDADYEMDDETRALVEANAFGTYDPTALDDPGDEMPTVGASNGLKLADLTGVAYDDEKWDQLLDQLTIDDMTLLVNLGGWQTAAIDSVGKVATADCDGPAGVNNFITQKYGTSFPAEVLMAQTWSKQIAEKIGDAMGTEYEEIKNFGWYGPAMNNHRSSFSGRNFEYFSEDGVLAGYFAAAEVNGAISHGVYPYIKHFALNDQETNRCAFLLTYTNEQAMREIYLKPFELCVKNYAGKEQGKGLAVMSAFNWIGPVPACGNSQLLKTVLRDEWGFVGMVETDYDGSYGYQITDHCIKSGNDLMLGFNAAESNVISDTDSATTVKALRQASKNILYVVGNSGYYADGDPTSGMDNMTKTFILIDLLAAIVLIGITVLVILRWRKKNA